MYIYIAYLIYSFTISFFSIGFYKKYRNEILTFFLWLGTFLIMALRSKTVGNDLERYINFYEHLSYYKSVGILKEMGYVAFLDFLHFFKVSHQGYVAVVSFIISFSFARFFFKYSKDVFFSFFLYFTIGLFAFSLTGIRQSIAISITLFSIDYIFKKKIFLFVLLVLLAYTFHRSAIFFLPTYMLAYSKKWSNKYLIIAFAIGLFVIVFKAEILTLSSALVFNTYKNTYLEGERASLNILPVLVNLSFTLSVLYFWLNQGAGFYKQNIQNKVFFIFSIIFSYISLISIDLSIVSRIGYFYSIANLVLIPNVLSEFKQKRIANSYKFVIYILSIIFFFMANDGGILKIDNYSFFWE